jgi:hypothetical protein
MTITRDRPAHTLHMNQELLITNLLDTYDLINAKPRPTPLSTSVHLPKDGGVPLDTKMFSYRPLVGSMLYLAVTTRPDIAYAVGMLAKYSSNPTDIHWREALNMLRYLKGTKSQGLTFSGGDITIMGYCDADYAGDLDTRRSTTGYVFILGGAAISWSSRRQHTVAASTAEAEYMATAAATKEAL